MCLLIDMNTIICTHEANSGYISYTLKEKIYTFDENIPTLRDSLWERNLAINQRKILLLLF